MPSGIYTKIKIHPFYQQFLRGYFHETDIVFKYPPRHDLLTRLEAFLSVKPNNKTFSWDDEKLTMLIELPHMEHKDPFWYNYISERSNNYYTRRIRDFYLDVYHEKCGRMERQGFYREEIINTFIEEYNISPTYIDLLKKEYSRYKASIYNRKYRKSKKKLHKLSA